MEYKLIVETKDRQVDLRLVDQDGQQLAANQLAIKQPDTFKWEGLFNTRQHLALYANAPAEQATMLAELGAFLGTEVLGPDIMAALTRSSQRRALLVQLPAIEGDALAAALARVPWEIASQGVDAKSLMQENVVVRAITESMPEPDSGILEAAEDVSSGKDALKILLVFAEAPGSSPLAMRLERQKLLHLFRETVQPKQLVQVDVLCHGVTRARLRSQITQARGYHIIHWSGHGHVNRLELSSEDGERETISGEDLLQLFNDAGGYYPQLTFLSTCHSGAFIDARDWEELRAALRGEDTKAAPVRELNAILEERPGYTGVALELLNAGAPQVIAMRYEVGDDYARELAIAFYGHLLGGKWNVDDALTHARRDLLGGISFAAVDHATPLMFGQEQSIPKPAAQHSPQLDRRRPRPWPLLTDNTDLNPADYFVGRGAPLTRLNRDWLSENGPDVALIQGLAGLGKTALAAEAIDLWHSGFDWVMAFQAKPHPLSSMTSTAGWI